MILSKQKIEEIKEQLLCIRPMAYITIATEYGIISEEYYRDNISNEDYWEWNLFYLLLILEAEGVSYHEYF